MSLIEIIRAVFINISTNKVRVFLTSLGIIVGSFTIIMVVGIGKGSQADVEEQYKNLSVGTLYVMNTKGVKTTETLDFEDVKAMQEGNFSAIKNADIMLSSNVNVSYYDISYSSLAVGATKNFKEINSLELDYGEFINEYANEKKERVVVIGTDLAEILFEGGASEAVGKDIKLNGKKYEIIGVLKRSGNSLLGFSPDEGIILPYETAVKYIMNEKSSPKITVLVKDIDSVEEAKSEITEILNKNHKGKSDQFMIMDAGSRLVAAQESAATMTAMLISVATCVLVVGGIGIMNVLLVSVKERTREIGILKAIGAQRRDILLQFLLEAIIISASGGAIGITISVLIIPIIHSVGLSYVPSTYGYGLGFIFSVVIGTFFGYYPAAKAASLKPIDALNHE
ncbi:ABC transporter permease [Clostridium ganghwense]|uniref:ABC transporter permease n=1 Tax=Clostridium ganghwense TaxID=312089 RepID=A0ABT4CTH3_9CLOT|nr:ABC transporter permease [Clostridium ganghwense]MCY6371341.1 ABC transporter permease [Clostridium ganghwense]